MTVLRNGVVFETTFAKMHPFTVAISTDARAVLTTSAMRSVMLMYLSVVQSWINHRMFVPIASSVRIASISMHITLPTELTRSIPDSCQLPGPVLGSQEKSLLQ